MRKVLSKQSEAEGPKAVHTYPKGPRVAKATMLRKTAQSTTSTASETSHSPQGRMTGRA